MKRSKHNLSTFKPLTMNQGEWVPINCYEVIPGDSVQAATSALIRMSPLLAPVMTPVNARVQHIFVPNRLIWEEWEDFITGGEDGLDSSTFPTIDLTSVTAGSLADHLGLPVGTYNASVSALPFRAYALAWNELIRNTRLQTELTVDLTSGTDTTTNQTLQNINWEKDRYTNAADDTQLGTEISLPLGTSAPVVGDGTQMQLTHTSASGTPANVTSLGSTHDAMTIGSGFSKNIFVPDDESFGAFADLTSATAATINDLRRAIGLQKFAEARQLYGSRYVEYLRYAYNVKSSDGRLDRPEYIAGGRQTIQFSEVLSTDGVNTGDMKGHGIAAVRSNKFRRFFEEHGIVITLLSVQPKTIYSNGIPPMWNKTDRTEFFQKELQNIGLQEIPNKEIYAAHSSPDDVFGYSKMYDDYRQGISGVSGDYNVGGNLDHWTMVRHFTSDPALNDTFIKSNPTNRIYASTTEDQLYVMANNSVVARRPIPRTGNPIGVI